MNAMLSEFGLTYDPKVGGLYAFLWSSEGKEVREWTLKALTMLQAGQTAEQIGQELGPMPRPPGGCGGFYRDAQMLLGIMTFVPGVGIVAGGMNAGILAYCGDWEALLMAGLIGSTFVAMGAIPSSPFRPARPTGGGGVGTRPTSRPPAYRPAPRPATQAPQARPPRVSCLTNSFVAGTPVLMADGRSKPIQDVNVGEWVWAEDPQTGERGPRQVITLIHSQGNKELVEIEIDGEIITATDEHPFWVPSRGEWIEAEDLQVGDELQTCSGKRTDVDRLYIHNAAFATVYNLTIEGLHTYYVVAGDHPVLVHNAKCRRVTPEWATRRWHEDQARIRRIRDQMREFGYSEEDIATWIREAEGIARGRLTGRVPSGDLPPWPAYWHPDYPTI